MLMDPREELVQHYKWLRQYGYNDSHSGNASIRDGDTIWVTPTGACADTLEVDDLVRCNIDGSIGDRASLDGRLHLNIYQQNPETAAILHSHGAYSVAMTLDGNDFEPVDFEGAYYFKKVPVVTVPYERYVDDVPDALASTILNQRIAIVRGHGVYAQARSMNLAYKWTCSLELSAKTAFIAKQAGTAK
jgi:L-fuculose-phosphate aldolase